MIKFLFRRAILNCLVLIFVISCKKDETPPSIVQFPNSSLTALEFGGTQKIGINFSLPLQSDIILTVDINEQTAVYGKDYTTVPDGTTKTISISIPKGASAASFDFIPTPGTKVASNKKVNFTLAGPNNNIQFGSVVSTQVTIVDDASLVQFATANISFYEFGTSKTVSLTFTSPLQSDGNLSIGISDSTAVYGTDYTTSPDGSSKTMMIPVSKGATSASFIIQPIQRSSQDGNKIVNFSITGLAQAMQFGPLIKLKANIIDDLVCYLPMNGNAVDASFYASSTQINGASLTSGRNALPNTAFQMDGISNDIVISNSTVLDTLHRITLTAWIKPVSFAGEGNNAIIEKPYFTHDNPYYQYKLGITGDQRLNLPGSFLFTLSIGGNYQYVTSNANAWIPGNWYFVSGTYDGNKMILYINGNQVAITTVSGKIDSYGADLYLGLVRNASAYTPGTFGDIRIYSRALSASEISSLYLK